MPDGTPRDLPEVGRIGRAHGVRGDLYVDLLTDRTERVAPGARVRAGSRWLVITSSTSAVGRWRVHFEGVDDRTAAEALTNTVLYAEPLAADPDDDALWVGDLIGARVVDRAGTDHGTCVSVVANPAHDLLELESGALVPVVFIVTVEPGLVTIDPPAGLFELWS